MCHTCPLQSYQSIFWLTVASTGRFVHCELPAPSSQTPTSTPDAPIAFPDMGAWPPWRLHRFFVPGSDVGRAGYEWGVQTSGHRAASKSQSCLEVCGRRRAYREPAAQQEAAVGAAKLPRRSVIALFSCARLLDGRSCPSRPGSQRACWTSSAASRRRVKSRRSSRARWPADSEHFERHARHQQQYTL